jgi:hypothetical protein
MEIKVITKSVRDRLDSFVGKSPIEATQESKSEPIEYVEAPRNKKVIKKNDGLIERIDNKIYITEDNRQLLND